MALSRSLRLYLYTAINFNLNRSGKFTSSIVRSQKYSTDKNINKEVPVKYTTNLAAKVLIAENLKLTEKKDTPWVQPYVISASLLAFLIYFCVLREENDIDEMIKGNDDVKTDYATYIDLNIKLHYCKLNNLPTEGIKAKINELKKRLEIPEDIH